MTNQNNDTLLERFDYRDCNGNAVELKMMEPCRSLLSVDGNYNVTFADDLTLDEAKELLRRFAVAGAKITKAQAELSAPWS